MQTKNFAAIRKKLETLLDEYQIELVFPIPQQKWIATYHADGHLLRRRKSPKRGNLLHLFDELIRFPQFVHHKNFTLTAILIDMEEHRCDDGRGSWRRRGLSIVDRSLLAVNTTYHFHTVSDFLPLIPANLEEPFSNKDFAAACQISTRQSQRIVYCLRKMDALQIVGKKGNAYLYQKNQ